MAVLQTSPTFSQLDVRDDAGAVVVDLVADRTRSLSLRRSRSWGDLRRWDSGDDYSPDAVTGRMVSGDYNGGGRDDIAMFYPYSTSSERMHMLLSH